MFSCHNLPCDLHNSDCWDKHCHWKRNSSAASMMNWEKSKSGMCSSTGNVRFSDPMFMSWPEKLLCLVCWIRMSSSKPSKVQNQPRATRRSSRCWVIETTRIRTHRVENVQKSQKTLASFLAHQAGVPNEPETLKTAIEQVSNLFRVKAECGCIVL